MPNKPAHKKMRIIHRYLGFFLAGIMAMYAMSGIVLVFRNTDFLKKEVTIEETISAKITASELGRALHMNKLKVERQQEGIYYFKNGTYNSETGLAKYTKKELPYVLDRMTHLHKANTNDPLYFLNIFFGTALLFFVISSFWMFMPGSDIFRKGLYFVAAGIVLTLLLLFV